MGVGAPRDATAIGASTASAGLGIQKFVSYPSSVLPYDLNRSAASARKKKEEAFVVQRLYNAAGTVPAVGDSIVFVDVEVSEPLLMSPLSLGRPKTKRVSTELQT